MLGLPAGAQRQLYLCHGDSCDAVEVNPLNTFSFLDDSLRIGQQAPYPLSQLDSIVFKRPQKNICWRGWAGSLQEGLLTYDTRQQFTQAGNQSSTVSFGYDVSFLITASQGVCQAAYCQLTFAELWMPDCFMGDWLEITNSPYIYVKLTQTGPRKHEVWTMGHSGIIPYGIGWTQSGCQLMANCSEVLAGRTMDEVVTLVEAWVHQPAIKTDNPDYEE